MLEQAASSFRECYKRDGFYIHRESVLSPETLARAAAGLELVRNGGSDTGKDPDSRGWKPGDDPRSLCKIEQPQIASLGLRKALRSPQLGALAAAVTGAVRVQVWWVQGLVKPGVSGEPTMAMTNVGWHQDLSYWSAWEEGSELFTAWLVLNDVTKDSGPMVFVPGSHRWGLLPGGDFFAQDQEAIRARINIPAGGEWRTVDDILPAGGVSFHHPMLFHGSHRNNTANPRCSLAIHMRTENSAPKPESWVARYLDRPDVCPVIFGELDNGV